MFNQSSVLKIVFKNGLILTVPPLVISFGLWPFLPKEYSLDVFNKGIPNSLMLFENIFRALVFISPLFFSFELQNRKGWIVYLTGLLIYLLSYIIQIITPGTTISDSAFIFTAPAWTTIVWFIGIGILCKRSWLPIKNTTALYTVLSGAFVVFHVTHASLVWFINKK